MRNIYTITAFAVTCISLDIDTLMALSTRRVAL
jgi:hypothetical protein